MSLNDYIVITGSRNLGDESEDKDVQKEGDESSRRALEEQGVFLDEHKDRVEEAEPHDEFSEKLKNLGGIEIISGGEDREDY